MDWFSGGQEQRRFESFVAEVTNDLVRTGYLMTCDLSETEDLVQETLLRTARRWNRVRSMDHPAAYARRILVNLVIDGKEGRKRRRNELDSSNGALEEYADETANRVIRGIDARSDFRLALATLPPQQRAVIVLRYWEDLPETEVAGLLGCSVGTVKSTASRGLARLRAALNFNDHPVSYVTASANDRRRTTS
jgi:RNA polymerase sigma-70 factor (sigma-E family)